MLQRFAVLQRFWVKIKIGCAAPRKTQPTKKITVMAAPAQPQTPQPRRRRLENVVRLAPYLVCDVCYIGGSNTAAAPAEYIIHLAHQHRPQYRGDYSYAPQYPGDTGAVLACNECWETGNTDLVDYSHYLQTTPTRITKANRYYIRKVMGKRPENWR